jgi:hypothetical protein
MCVCMYVYIYIYIYIYMIREIFPAQLLIDQNDNSFSTAILEFG